MSKYESLWKWIQKNGDDKFSLTYAEIEKIAGIPSVKGECGYVVKMDSDINDDRIMNIPDYQYRIKE